MALFDTVANIIQDAAVELGLADEVDDVFASTDSNIIQLRTLMRGLGRRMVMEQTWLQNVIAYSTILGSGSFLNMPTGFDSLVDNTAWNVTRALPLRPISVQLWEAYQTSLTVAPVDQVSIRMRFRADFPGLVRMYFVPTQTVGDTVELEYRTRYWAQSNGSSTVNLDAPTANDDTVNIDAPLFVAALKLAFAEAKGFDTTALLDTYQSLLAAVQSANVLAAPTLSLNGAGAVRLVDGRNVPETGYGS